MSGDPALADDAGHVREYQTSEGMRLKYRHWKPCGAPTAYVIALHGIQSHSGWFGYSSQRMANAGIDVRFLDRRGSGLNPQDRGHVSEAARLMEDVSDFLQHLEKERAERPAPLFLLGLSWGARLAAAVCGRSPGSFDGLILLYPGICTRTGPNRIQCLLLRWAQRLGGGRLRIPIPLRAEQFTSEPKWQSFIQNDPLAVRRVSVSFVLAGEHLATLAKDALATLKIPRLVMLAGQDDIVDNAETRCLLSPADQNSLQIIEYPEARHTLEVWSDRDRFVADLIHWIESDTQRKHRMKT